MKLKIALVIVAIVALGLGIGLIKTNQDAAKAQADAQTIITQQSNDLSKTIIDLENEKQKTSSLETDVSNRDTQLITLSNTVAQANDTIKDKDTALKAAQDEVVAKDKTIVDETNMINQLNLQASDLTNQIADRDKQIADTQRKLAASQGDQVYLEQQLQRLMAEKAELERKFTDIAVLKDQVHKLKEEMDISRRIAWIRAGLYPSDEKGAQRLMQGATAGNPSVVLSTNAYNLNVEVKSDGSVRELPPLQTTPAPGDSNSPAK